MSYRVFTDFHHGALLQSLILLFERRLGGQVFRPIGLEWFEKGFWKINDQYDTANQFLGMGSIPVDLTPPLNDLLTSVNGDFYFVRDTIDGTNKAITFDAFMRVPIDIVIASIPQHIEPFARLCEMHPSKPKLIFQIGNQWDDLQLDGKVSGVMASATLPYKTYNFPVIQYHQEFDTEIFSPFSKIIDNDGELTFPEKNVFSFINILQNHRDYSMFLSVENLLSSDDWVFRSYGGQCRDGNMNGAKELADKMREARFIWHTKQGGDGYGHILHNAFAVGRPVIIRMEDYKGKLGADLLTPWETCIAIDGLTPEMIIERIQYFSKTERYAEMSQNVIQRFREVVDFDAEQRHIEYFLQHLQ